MNFGLCLPIRRDCSIEFNINLAKKAEELGFDSVWVSDHVVVPNKTIGSFSKVFYDPFVLLAAIASDTESIKLGTSVIILPYRNPVVVAKMVATIDMLSEGRFILGIAPGWLKEEFESLNADFDNRGEITDEYIKSIVELWANDNPEFNGKYVNFSDISFYPKPYNKRIPEIWVGGSSKRARKRALELATGWQPTWISPEDYSKNKEEFQKSAGEIGVDLSNFSFSVRNRIRIETPGNTADTTNDPSYMFRGTMDQIKIEVEKFAECGAEYVVFDPEAESDSDTYKLLEIISENLINTVQ